MSIASRQPARSRAQQHGVASGHGLRRDRPDRSRRDTPGGALAHPLRLAMFRWPAAQALADTFQKVRLQRQWALARIAERAEDAARADAERAALEADAEAAARRHGFNVSALSFQFSRYRFGTLADTDDAPRQRRIYRRAIEIACARASEPDLEAAE